MSSLLIIRSTQTDQTTSGAATRILCLGVKNSGVWLAAGSLTTITVTGSTQLAQVPQVDAGCPDHRTLPAHRRPWTTWILCYKQYIQTFSSCFSSSVVLLCTQSLCCCNVLDWLKLLLHSEHLYGFSPVWIRMWTFRIPDRLNVLSHIRHLYGFSPVWTLRCLSKFERWLNALSHTWHSYGLSPLWILLCTTR